MAPTHSRPAQPAIDLRDLPAHAAWLSRLAVRLVGAGADSEDLVQETWSVAMRAAPERPEAIRPWLSTVLRNFARFRGRSDQNRRRRESEFAHAAWAEPPTPEDLLARHEALVWLADAVRRLDEPFRSTILLRYAEGLTPAAITKHQAIPAGTVRWRLKRGLDELRGRLEDGEGPGARAWKAWLAFGQSAPTIQKTTAGSLGKGVFLMQTKTKGAVGLVVILLGVLSAVLLRRTGDDGRASAPAPSRQVQPEPTAGTAAANPLFRVAEGATIAGSVHDREGQPVAAATVIVTSQPTFNIGPIRPDSQSVPGVMTTGADGRFELRHLRPGIYRVTASAPGFAPSSAGPVLVAPEQASSPVDVVLTRGGHTLSGRVLDAGGGPIPGALVRATLDGLDLRAADHPVAGTFAGVQGQYQLTLPPGTHPMFVEADAYATERTTLTIGGDQTRDFRLVPSAAIAGRVVERGTGNPVVAARVFGGGKTVDTDTQGRFTLRNLAPGEYALGVRAGAMVGRSIRPIELGVADYVDGVVIEVDPGETVTGRVIWNNGAPVSEASVQIVSALPHAGAPLLPPEKTTTDRDGSFRFEGLWSGGYMLNAESPVGGYATTHFSVADGPPAAVKLVLTGTGAVFGRVVDKDGKPAPGSIVHAFGGERRDDRVSGPARADAEGRFRLDRVDSGDLELTVRHPEKGSAWMVTKALRPGEEREVLLRLAGQVFVRGRVAWEDGEPAAGILMSAVPQRRYETGSHDTTSGADGRYVLGPFVEGDSFIVSPRETADWRGAGETGHLFKMIRIDGPEDKLDVDFILPRADQHLRGIVLGPDGHPLGAAVVTTTPGRDGYRAVTGDDGRFTIEELRAGTYTVHAERAGFPPAEVSNVSAGSEDVVVRFLEGAGLTGKVTRANGEVVGPFTIWARPAGKGQIQTSFRFRSHAFVPTGRDFEIGALPADTYDLFVVTNDGESGALAAIAVAAGERRSGLNIVLDAGMVLLGRVVDLESRQPLEGAAVEVRSSGSQHATSIRADRQGRFRFTDVVRGVSLSLAISFPGTLGHRSQVLPPALGDDLDLGDIPILAERPPPKAKGRAGIVISRNDDGYIVITGAPPDQPAAKAGLRKGDVVLAIDGKRVHNIDLNTAVTLVGGNEPGTTLLLEVQAPDARPRQVRVTRM